MHTFQQVLLVETYRNIIVSSDIMKVRDFLIVVATSHFELCGVILGYSDVHYLVTRVN